jgi:hypothetical protein
MISFLYFFFKSKVISIYLHFKQYYGYLVYKQ